MKSNYKRLGNYITQVDERNKNLKVTNLQGVSINKEFIPSIANIIGTDLSSYKIVKKGQFAYGPVTSRNGNKISVALLDGDDCIISSSYTSFKIISDELLPEYLMLWFRRPEFDRYARYMSNGSAREIFDWKNMCDVMLPIPSIQEQEKIVYNYKAVVDRIELLKKINKNLLFLGNNIYKQYFVDKAKDNDSYSIHYLKEFVPVITGKKDANVVTTNGKYQFFSCSQEILWTEDFSFDGDAILVAGNGDFSVKFYSGKFEAYQRTYVLFPNDSKLRDLLFYSINYYLPFATTAARGSVISFITKGILEEIKFFLPIDQKQLTRFCNIFNKINKVIQCNNKESLILNKQKELLLATLTKEV